MTLFWCNKNSYPKWQKAKTCHLCHLMIFLKTAFEAKDFVRYCM